MISTRENKKILFIASFTPPLNAGSGLNAYNFGKFLVKKGYQVSLLSLNRRGKLRSRENDEGMKIIRLLYFNHNLLTKLLSLFIILPGYILSILKHRYIFIYGGNIIAFEFIIFVGKLLGKKIVFRSTMYNEDDAETLIKKKWFGKLNYFALKRVTLYFSINPAFSNSWEEVFRDRGKIFESVHGVDISMFFPVNKDEKVRIRQKLQLPGDVFIIISVGYLIERKGFRNVFEALAKLDKPFLYLVVGDYHVPDDHYLKFYNQEMKSLMDFGKKKLGRKVIFTGPKSNINEYLNASDVFILNSVKEGVSNAVLESMACGLPTIVREIPGTENLVMKPDHTILITSGSCDDILRYIRKLHRDIIFRRKIGAEGAQIIRQEGSFDKVWNKLAEKLKYTYE